MSKSFNNLYEPDNVNRRAQVSYMIRTYIAGFITEKILQKHNYNIAALSKMNSLQLSFILIQNQDNITVIPPRTYDTANPKASPFMIGYADSTSGSTNVNIEFALLVYDEVCDFLISQFNVESSILQQAKPLIDLDYLSTIVYPMRPSSNNFQLNTEYPIAPGPQKADFTTDISYSAAPLVHRSADVVNRYTSCNEWEPAESSEIPENDFAIFSLSQEQTFKEFDHVYLNDGVYRIPRIVNRKNIETAEKHAGPFTSTAS